MAACQPSVLTPRVISYSSALTVSLSVIFTTSSSARRFIVFSNSSTYPGAAPKSSLLIESCAAMAA